MIDRDTLSAEPQPLHRAYDVQPGFVVLDDGHPARIIRDYGGFRVLRRGERGGTVHPTILGALAARGIRS
jgi:hypothetical protein